MAIDNFIGNLFSRRDAVDEQEEDFIEEETGSYGFGDDEEYYEDRDEQDYDTPFRFSFGSRNRVRSNRESYDRRNEGSFFDSFREDAPAESPSSTARIVLMRPEHFSEVKRIADNLVSNRSLVINFDRMNSGEIQRTIDFLSGATYAKGGKVEKISNTSVIFAVGSVDLVGRIEELSKMDSYFN